MMGSADEIKYINRDELTHCVLFANMIREIGKENPGFFKEDLIYEMFSTAVTQEIEWTNHIIGDAVLGISPDSTEKYTKFIANKRLKEIGLKPLYDGYEINPYRHLEKIADVSGEGDVKSNFFEAKVTAYNQSSAIEGWDSF